MYIMYIFVNLFTAGFATCMYRYNHVQKYVI